jgi:phosphodiesterase/alkaline phosphatase D-like protein
VEGILVWGTDAKALPPEERSVALKAGEPVAVTLDGLAPDTRYLYDLRDATTRKRLLPASGMGTFHTQRARGSAFTFTVTADSHLDGNTSPEVYQRTPANALADGPDFHLDLGDTFMTDRH